MRRFYDLLLISGLLFSIGCTSIQSREGSGSLPDTSSLVVLRPVDAVLNNSGETEIGVVKSKIEAVDEFQNAQFVDSQNGWAVSRRSLYKTSNGGTTWNRLTIDVSPDSHISSFYFVEERRGWLAIVSKVEVGRYGRGNSSRILVTNDGGISWTEQATFVDEVRINAVKFLNSNEGLVVGAKVVGEQPAYEELFAASTADGGKSWNNISERIKPSTQDEYSKADPGRKIHWTTRDRILLLTTHRIIESVDGGQLWKTRAQFKDQRPNGSISSTGYYNLVSNPQGRIAVIAGARGEEGYWGDWVVQGNDKTWSSRELVGLPIFDAVFISENEIIACGWEIKAQHEQMKAGRADTGVIIHSADGGKSWSRVYSEKSGEPIVSLSRVREDQFYALGSAGTFLRFVLRKG